MIESHTVEDFEDDPANLASQSSIVDFNPDEAKKGSIAA